MNRRVLLLLLLVGLLVLLGVVGAPPTSADSQTHCWCVQRAPNWWCYRCCDLEQGCYDLYCDTACP